MAGESHYRGRLAPTPTGLMHLGHAARSGRPTSALGALAGRCSCASKTSTRCALRGEFAAAMLDDLRWFGLEWQEGPELGGPCGPYVQSQRLPHYFDAWRRLYAAGAIYPSPHSRKDVDLALLAPHDAPPEGWPERSADGASAGVAGEALEEPPEPIFPTSLRPAAMPRPDDGPAEPGAVNWRFRVPDGEEIRFVDGRYGETRRVAGVDFGDFLVWRRDGYPSYELAVVEDDHAMQVSEVVRAPTCSPRPCGNCCSIRAGLDAAAVFPLSAGVRRSGPATGETFGGTGPAPCAKRGTRLRRSEPAGNSRGRARNVIQELPQHRRRYARAIIGS